MPSTQLIEETLSSQPESEKSKPLVKHVMPFAKPDMTFTPLTIGKKLDELDGDEPYLKGLVISFFNSEHGNTSRCPVAIRGQFTPDEDGYARFLHLGTTRVWNEDGSINEANWTKLEKACAESTEDSNVKIVRYSKFKEYLDHCAKHDKPQDFTGRNANSFLSSASFQKVAAHGGWDEAYRLIARNNWIIDSKGNKDPYMSLARMRLFFEDTGRAIKEPEPSIALTR